MRDAATRAPLADMDVHKLMIVGDRVYIYIYGTPSKALSTRGLIFVTMPPSLPLAVVKASSSCYPMNCTCNHDLLYR